MSAPNIGLKRAEYFKYSILAIRTSSALNDVLQGKDLTEDERAVLTRAASFLKDISTGANFIAHGSFQEGFSPSRSVKALRQAMGPIMKLRVLIKDDDVASFFEQLTTAVSEVSKGHLANGASEQIQSAINFFEAFNESVGSELNVKHLSPRLPKVRERAFAL